MPVLSKFHGSSFILSSQIIPFASSSFLNHPEYVRSCIPVSFHRRPSFQKNSSPSSFQLPLSIYPGASFKCSPCSFTCRHSIIPEFGRHLRRFICVPINSRLSPHSNISIVPVQRGYLFSGPKPTGLFPGSYLTLLISPGVILKFFSESDIRMDSISQMFFQDRFQIISLLAQPLCFSFFRSISVILVVFSVVI